MPSINTIQVAIAPNDLLSCIWFSDGSGARDVAGLPITENPDAYTITRIEIAADQAVIYLTLKRVEL